MAVTYAVFSHGRPTMVDYTPGSAVSAGDVIVIGAEIRIAHVDIAANALGALAIGYGVYTMPKSSAGSSAIADGAVVYWDPATHQITTTAGSLKKLGTTVGASLDADTTQKVLHIPN
jgi:predicted RecA/RadA family phage recombinase